MYQLFTFFLSALLELDEFEQEYSESDDPVLSPSSDEPLFVSPF